MLAALPEGNFKMQKPVTIVTGFLGSGKTTLLNRILSEPHGLKIAVILNEIGEVNLDSQLVVQSLGEELKIMNNGCICCTVRGDLSKIADELVSKGVEFDSLVVETTGMADPSPVAQTFFMEEKLLEKFYLDAIVTVVDALNIDKNLSELKETQDQIGFADVVLLNKSDLVSENELAEIETKIRGINALAKIVRTVKCVVPISEVLNLKAFDVGARAEIDPKILTEYHEHSHDEKIQSVYLEEARPLDMEKLNRFMQLVVNELGSQVLRSKGVVSIDGMSERMVFQGVHMNVSSAEDRAWRPNEARLTQMVFIGRHLPKDVLQEGLSMCVAHSSETNA
jgi:G3E family GTPase